jgi:hypothetical protein
MAVGPGHFDEKGKPVRGRQVEIFQHTYELQAIVVLTVPSQELPSTFY